MQKLARVLAPLDLRPSEASVLLVTEANPNLTQSDIGRMLELAGANMARHEEGLMARIPASQRAEFVSTLQALWDCDP